MARLAATPHEARVLRPVAVALVAVLLATALLLMPAQDHSIVASTSADTSTPGSRAPAAARDDTLGQRAEPGSHDPARDRSSATSSDDAERSEDGRRAPSPGGAPADQRETTAAGDMERAATATRAAPGGRDAGAGTDDTADAALSQAWQGEMATTLRTLAVLPPVTFPTPTSRWRPTTRRALPPAAPSQVQPCGPHSPPPQRPITARAEPRTGRAGLRPRILLRPERHNELVRTPRSLRSPSPQQLNEVCAALDGVIVGQQDVVDGIVTAVFAGGHVLMEGLPGLGKTHLAKALAAALGLQWSRVQCTPDLMPADVTGAEVYSRPRTGGRVRVPARARCSRSSCWPTRSTAPRRAPSPRCSRPCRRCR